MSKSLSCFRSRGSPSSQVLEKAWLPPSRKGVGYEGSPQSQAGAHARGGRGEKDVLRGVNVCVHVCDCMFVS